MGRSSVGAEAGGSGGGCAGPEVDVAVALRAGGRLFVGGWSLLFFVVVCVPRGLGFGGGHVEVGIGEVEGTLHALGASSGPLRCVRCR